MTSHEAFGYLATRYGLQQQGVAGLSPDQEPDPARLGELAQLAHDQGVTTVFTEETVSPRIAQTLARDAGGLRTEVLSPLESLSNKDRAARARLLQPHGRQPREDRNRARLPPRS